MATPFDDIDTSSDWWDSPALQATSTPPAVQTTTTTATRSPGKGVVFWNSPAGQALIRAGGQVVTRIIDGKQTQVVIPPTSAPPPRASVDPKLVIGLLVVLGVVVVASRR